MRTTDYTPTEHRAKFTPNRCGRWSELRRVDHLQNGLQLLWFTDGTTETRESYPHVYTSIVALDGQIAPAEFRTP